MGNKPSIVSQQDLESAIKVGDSKQIAAWIASGSIDVNARVGSHTSTALILAAQRGDKAIVELLLNAGARIEDCDDYGQTACHTAICMGHFELMRLLLARGASVSRRDNNGNCPLFSVLSLASSDIAIELIEAGAPLDRPLELCRAAVMDTRLTQMLIDRHVAFGNWLCSEGCTPCHRLCWRGGDNGALMRMLVNDASVDPNTLDSEGRTCALLCATFTQSKSLRHLIALGADIERADPDLQTPLHHACWHGSDTSAVYLLLAAGAAVNATNNRLRTPAHFVADRNNASPSVRTEILVALLSVGANFDAADDAGNTPRRLAANWGFTAPAQDDLDAARKSIASAQLDFVRERAFEVCVGLQSRPNLDALQMCEILVHACGPIASIVPFHVWWKIATTVKHF